MLKVKVNDKKEYKIEPEEKGGKIDGNKFSWDLLEIKKGTFHIIKDNRSFEAEVISADIKAKSFVIKVNNNKYSISVKDKYDELLHSLGMDNLAAQKVNDIKAPMPGLVLNIIVEEGTVVKKGDALLVLEAMKMENILKSPADGVVKKVNVKKGVAVEKNQVLINFS